MSRWDHKKSANRHAGAGGQVTSKVKQGITREGKIRSVTCPQCGAQPQEKCRRWVSEAYHHGNMLTVGEGRWQYLKTYHREREHLALRRPSQ